MIILLYPKIERDKATNDRRTSNEINYIYAYICIYIYRESNHLGRLTLLNEIWLKHVFAKLFLLFLLLSKTFIY